MLLSLALLVLLASCATEPEQALSQAFVAPASINLRSQLGQKSGTVSVLKHGERVTIVDVRRRFVKVRTQNGAEGWMDAFDLLNPNEMARIQRERAVARELPSEGTATAYELLNIHLDPSRRSPAFAQIPEGGAVSVLARKITPKATGAPRSVIAFEKPKPPARRPRRERLAKVNPRQPPKPAAPKPPENWTRIWGSGETEAAGPSDSASNPSKLAGKETNGGKPPILESWTLVRTKNGTSGWVLSRNLMMSIPDDVAQYAGGRRITSYFDLGVVNDEKEGQKHNWLWTTASDTQAADFDAWRVFLWNRRKHRYETSYRQRDLEGYFPVHVEPPAATHFGRSFQLITKDDDGKFRRRTYLFDGVKVHLTATEDYKPQEVRESRESRGINANALEAKKSQPGWLRRKWVALQKAFSNNR